MSISPSLNPGEPLYLPQTEERVEVIAMLLDLGRQPRPAPGSSQGMLPQGTHVMRMPRSHGEGTWV